MLHYSYPTSSFFRQGYIFDMKTVYFKTGEEIMSEGKSSSCAYIIETGSVEVSIINDHNERQVLSQLKENDMFGELGLIDGLPRTATVTALQDCTVNMLTKDMFDSLVKNNPEALMPFLKVMASRLRSTIELLESIQVHK